MQLTYNTMRFLTDEFSLYSKSGLLISKDDYLDLTDINKIERFTISGAEPSGSSRRFMFKVDDKVYTFNDQNPVEYTGAITTDDVLTYGNTAAQVENVKNFTAWNGKKVYPIIALYTDVPDTPTAKISVTSTVGSETLDKEYFWIFDFNPENLGTENLIILDFKTSPTVTGAASVTFLGKEGGQPRVADGYVPVENFIGKSVVAKGFNVKAVAHVDEVNGVNSAIVGRMSLLSTTDPFASTVYGEIAELYTIRKNYYLPLKTCAVVLKHASLNNGASLNVYYFVSSNVKTVKLKSIAVGTGTEQTVTLDTSKYFDPFSFQLYFDGVETTDFELATNSNIVKFTAPNGAGVSASYNYNFGEEVWHKMTPDPTQYDISDGRFVTRYYADIDEKNATYGGFKIVFYRPEDGDPITITRVATGAQEQVVLKYNPDHIECDADEWSINRTTLILTYTAKAGETVTIIYGRQAPNPKVYSFTAGWSV